MLKAQSGPTVVAGHSYGGQIMTALGTDAPNVVALVYVAGFGLDEGESIGGLLAARSRHPRSRTSASTKKAPRGSPEEDFLKHFAPDVDPIEAKVMFAVQQPLAAERARRRDGNAGMEEPADLVCRLPERRGHPARRGTLFATRMGATVSELAAGHVGMVSHPEEVTELIKSAAESVS